VFRSVLVVVDGSPDSDAALVEAIDIAVSEDAALTILAAARRPLSWATSGLAELGLAPRTDELNRETESILRRAVGSVPADLPVRTLISEGRVKAALRQALRSGEHDLVILGWRRRARLALLGGLSLFGLLRRPVPVLIVRR
jgi:nucleotide-binding universal stress UspA family protein